MIFLELYSLCLFCCNFFYFFIFLFLGHLLINGGTVSGICRGLFTLSFSVSVGLASCDGSCTGICCAKLLCFFLGHLSKDRCDVMQ
ncbi:uncharacterized protein BO87DRAFT_93353 [Aspergillus neoniger CBS 115656]|uniref:Uncharacterized protein n=1 Tax=Aspergillus neoniger (strain CBS 115656) TaxID=1448310 RepID=A0A318YZ17_ASPNB|nr:hypothetical protein BO87DRAFT_93353 [Aspergillus neoniger CBS 115656]PYH33098.1 hypothetical protein BO87DRAFT_93353 [Aspergillus neoniger CBS 115656]